MKFSKKEKMSITVLVLLALIVFMLFAFLSLIPIKKQVVEEKPDFSKIERVFELTTFKNYYHNVAVYEKQPDWLFKYGWGRFGYKKAYIEYDGIVEVGLKGGEIQISAPDEDNNVRVYLPKASIVGLNLEENSIEEVWSDTGVFTKISAKDKGKAVSDAQKKMEKTCKSDAMLLSEADNRNKLVIAKHIQRIGQEQGKTYNIIWEKKPIKE